MDEKKYNESEMMAHMAAASHATIDGYKAGYRIGKSLGLVTAACICMTALTMATVRAINRKIDSKPE